MQKGPQKKTLSDFLIFDLGTTNCFIANSLLSPLLHVKIHALVGNQRPSYDIFLAGGVSPWRPVRLEALSWRAVLLEAFSWRVVRLEAPEKFDNWRNVLLEKCPPWRRVRLEACPPGGMSAWRRVLLEACPLER